MTLAEGVGGVDSSWRRTLRNNNSRARASIAVRGMGISHSHRWGGGEVKEWSEIAWLVQLWVSSEVLRSRNSDPKAKLEKRRGVNGLCRRFNRSDALASAAQ